MGVGWCARRVNVTCTCAGRLILLTFMMMVAFAPLVHLFLEHRCRNTCCVLKHQSAAIYSCRHENAQSSDRKNHAKGTLPRPHPPITDEPPPCEGSEYAERG